jgi:transposase
MLKVDTQSWQQNPELLRQQAFTAEHPRTRERFMGLYEITNGKNATQVGQEIGRNPQTIMGWVPLSTQVEEAIDCVIRESLNLAATPPQERQAVPLPRWTLKRLAAWVKRQFNIDCCRDTLRKVLKGLGFSWKKARKLLNKADPNKRAAFLEKLPELLDDALHERSLLVYIDEAHIHLDTDEGYGWSLKASGFGSLRVLQDWPRFRSTVFISTL